MGVDNYARFYALLRRMPCADKETLVSQYSDGRTTHLRELSGSEYRAMCDAMARVEGEDESRRGLRRLRSAALHQMQLLELHAPAAALSAAGLRAQLGGRDVRQRHGALLQALAVIDGEAPHAQRPGLLRRFKVGAQGVVAQFIAGGGVQFD